MNLIRRKLQVLFLLFLPLSLFSQHCFSIEEETKHLAQEITFEPLSALISTAPISNYYSGSSNNTIIVAGGTSVSNNENPLYHDSIYILRGDRDVWEKCSEKLPAPMAEGLSFSFDNMIYCLGGKNEHGYLSKLISLNWDGEKVVVKDITNLPESRIGLSGAILDGTLYLAGGQDSSGRTRNDFWSLNLSAPIQNMQWHKLESWPGASRKNAIAVTQNGYLFLFGGQTKDSDSSGSEILLSDVFCYITKKRSGATGWSNGWHKLKDVPSDYLIQGSPAVSLGESHISFIAKKQNYTDPDGQAKNVLLLYHTVTDTWAEKKYIDDGSKLASNGFKHNLGWVVLEETVGAEESVIRPVHGQILTAQGKFGAFNWISLITYMILLLAMGYWFSKREKGTEDYFLASGRVPWWAAGLSLYATGISALPFLAIPAVVYATNCVRIVGNWTYIIVIPVIIFVFLPFFCRLKVTSAYEYLEKRFNLPVRMFGSAVFIISMLFKVAVIVYLPALALSSTTGINIYLCIVGIGVICIVYTVMGGVEAVIWTDVVQTVVLSVGAILCLWIVIADCGGFGEMLSIANSGSKFHTFNLDWDITGMTLWVIIVGVFFANSAAYISDQSLIQRYLTTRDEKEAARSLWLNIPLAVILSAPVWYLLGTSLYVFYKSNPDMLFVGKNDAIVPWFVMQNIPLGLSGIVIAGIFSATMSSLDSHMHSAATAYVVDFHKRLNPAMPDHKALALARWCTALIGIFGTVMAVVLVEVRQLPIFDLWVVIIGLTFGGITGVFYLGILTTRANGYGALIGVVFGAITPYLIKVHTDVNFYLYTAIGVITCFVSGYIASLLIKSDKKDLTGLTIYTIFKK